MKTIATFLLSLTIAVVGVGGFFYLQRLENRITDLEALVVPLHKEADEESASKSVAEDTRDEADPATEPTPPRDLTTNVESRSYLNELLEITQ